MNEELNKKLAKWAGFRLLPYKGSVEMLLPGEESESRIGTGDGYVWVAPDWEYGNGHWSIELPDFPQSLDACFQWLVPKAIDRIMAEQGRSSDLAYAILFKKWLQELELIIPEAALALCLAIDKLIDSQ